jgi:hypothetical protein
LWHFYVSLISWYYETMPSFGIFGPRFHILIFLKKDLQIQVQKNYQKYYIFEKILWIRCSIIFRLPTPALTSSLASHGWRRGFNSPQPHQGTIFAIFQISSNNHKQEPLTYALPPSSPVLAYKSRSEKPRIHAWSPQTRTKFLTLYLLVQRYKLTKHINLLASSEDPCYNPAPREGRRATHDWRRRAKASARPTGHRWRRRPRPAGKGRRRTRSTDEMGGDDVLGDVGGWDGWRLRPGYLHGS